MGTSIIQCIDALDQGIPTARTCLIASGVIAAGLQIDTAADFLFTGGLLLHAAIAFAHWWESADAS